MRTASQTDSWLNRFAWFTSAATLFLICSGGMVTSKNAGLAVPDWPTTFGYNMFLFPVSKWIGGIFFEHVHRLIASTVGFLTVVLAAWLWFTEPRRWVRNLGLVAVGAVILQGILGGVRVTMMKDQIGIFHACLAQAFFGLLVVVASATSSSWRSERPRSAPAATRIALIATALIYIQLALGATMRHQHRDLSITDFPAAYGQWLPDTSATAIAEINLQRDKLALSDVTAAQIWLQMAHRFGAVLVAIGVLAFFVAAHRAGSSLLRKLSAVWLFAVALQISLGAWVIWSNKAADVATTHVAVGAILFAVGVMNCALSLRPIGKFPARVPRRTQDRRRMKSATVHTEAPLAGHTTTRWSDFSQLIKARLTLLVLITTAVGFYLAQTPVHIAGLINVVIGAGLAAAGASALNQWWERDLDALMSRTRTRPVPSGRMTAPRALILGCVFSVVGVVYLATTANALAAILAAVTLVIYVLAYTPLKRVTTTNTLIGAIPGALPPLIGWAAARGSLDFAAWTLFAILFLWQMPHFFAIAWMCRHDYESAGFRMLSRDDESGVRTASQAVLFSMLLLLVGGIPAFIGMTHPFYLLVELILGGAFIAVAMHFHRTGNVRSARLLFFSSIIYLPLLLVALMVTKT